MTYKGRPGLRVRGSSPWLALVLAVAGAAGLRAQSHSDTLLIAPGDPVPAHLVTPHRAAWAVYDVAPEGEPRRVGTWIDTYELVPSPIGERPLLRFGQEFTDSAGLLLFWRSHLVDSRTLEPISVHETNPVTGGFAEVLYRPGRVVGRVRPSANADAFTFEDTLPRPVWDPSFVGLLALDRPCRPGATVRMPFYPRRVGAGVLQWAVHRLVGPAVYQPRFGLPGISLPAGVAPCAVETSTGRRMLLVDRPPFGLRLEVPGGGADGATRVWEALGVAGLVSAGRNRSPERAEPPP